jgi:glycosyltransferase involved in cell wall biosynthesis
MTPIERLKVLKFISVFEVGGTERQFLYLTRNLDRSQFDLRMACLKKSGALLNEAEGLNVPIWEYKANSLYPHKAAVHQYRLARDIRKHGIQVVHGYGCDPTMFTVPAARLAGRCIAVVSVRDLGSYLKPLKRRAHTLACNFSDCVIANSGAARSWLVESGVNPELIQVIPNGIEVDEAPEPLADFPIRRQMGMDRNAPLVAVVCRLDRRKGLEYFLEAAAAVARRIPASRFLVVGDSNVEPGYCLELKNRAKAIGLGNNVWFTGMRHDVPQLLREVTLAVVPSLTESFSNSLLEAMAAGLPVVATKVGGNPEVVEDGKTAILVPSRDAECLARAMIQVVESPELATSLGHAGRERALKYFSIHAVLGRTQDLYLTLLERKGLVHLNADVKCTAGA